MSEMFSTLKANGEISPVKHNVGVYGGSRVGYLEHEIENWLRSRVRVGSGQPVLPPIEPPKYLRIIPIKEVARRVGVLV